MNQAQVERSDRIVSNVMRTFALIGVAAVLILIAWLIINGARLLPNGSGSLGAIVNNSSSSVFTAPKATHITFATSSLQTLVSGREATIAWDLDGNPDARDTYSFTYDCASNITIAVVELAGTYELGCQLPYNTRDRFVRIIPTLRSGDRALVEARVSIDTLEDTRLLTVVRSTTTPVQAPTTVTTTTNDTGTPAKPTTSDTPTPTPSQPVVVRPLLPGDLAVTVVATGIVVDVDGRDRFFEFDRIPHDERAALRFVVTNLGEQPSGAWAFIATLPIDGDREYRYVSPAQNSLLPGATTEFTLSFTEIEDRAEAIALIELVPVLDSDDISNNVDGAEFIVER